MCTHETAMIEKLLPLRAYEPKLLDRKDLRSSAVLIPILKRSGNQLLFTLRARHLRHHAGQISFPGGGVEPEERPWRAALREAEEEIGLAPEKVRPFGRLDDVYSPRGFHIQCFVGLVERFEPRLNPGEVEKLVEVDLDELFDDRLHEVRPRGNFPEVHYFHFKHGLVWGVTGLITYRLRQVLRGANLSQGAAHGSAAAAG